MEIQKEELNIRFKILKYLKEKTWFIFEFSLILFWGLWIGKEYLNFNSLEVPFGNEFGSVVASHNFWIAVQDCGLCALWDGTIQGGAPAFTDIYTGVFHPVTMISTLIWGVINGSKAIIIGSIWTAGFAQYWLSKELNLGKIARIWSILLVMAGGHLAGRMEAGLISLVLSTAMCSLVFPAILMLSRRKDNKSIVVLGVVLASAIISGQGYIQVGILISLPAIIFLILKSKDNMKLIFKNYLYAAFIAILLTAPLLLPYLMSASQFTKFTDPNFIHIQPIKYAPLNLIIDDLEFFKSDVLEKYPYPNLYVNFIGWIPVILAGIGIAIQKREDKNKINYLFSSIILVFLLVTPQFFQWLVQYWQGLEKVRLPPYILGIVIAPLVGLAAYGLDLILNKKWASITINLEKPISLFKNSISLKWLLIFPLVIGLNQAFQFTKSFYYTIKLDEDMFTILNELSTEDIQWIQTPFGEHYWIEPAIDMGYKVSPGIKPWRLMDNKPPLPFLEVTRNKLEFDENKILISENLPNVFIYKNENATYASVKTLGEVINCEASGGNGYIEVKCPENVKYGRLIIKENSLNGWIAWAGENKIQLVGEDWLEILIVPGINNYKFQYIPSDVSSGFLLMFIGLFLAIRLVYKKELKSTQNSLK
jgi:hypothetical protein